MSCVVRTASGYSFPASSEAEGESIRDFGHILSGCVGPIGISKWKNFCVKFQS